VLTDLDDHAFVHHARAARRRQPVAARLHEAPEEELMAEKPGVQRGGQEPQADEQDRPEQNVGYDEAVKGAPLSPAERDRVERESPLTNDDVGEEED
jgi:hypothetical protein